jgi:RNA polymerase sigma-70 factor (ECF subfamily)
MTVGLLQHEPSSLAVEALWIEFRERLRAFVARRIDNPADVDDIVQWAFLQMHRSLGTIRDSDRIHAWLYRTARRAIADYYRSGTRRHEVAAGGALDLEGLTTEVTVADDAGEAHEVAACLAPMVDSLPSADREVIVLTELQGLRLADAAAAVGISLSAAKSRALRARQRLRKMLLDCCHVALDGRGRPMSCATRRGAIAPCGCAGE